MKPLFREVMITDECIACGACQEACPLECILENWDDYEYYLINIEKCNFCKGTHDSPQCMEVCPIPDAIIIYEY